MSFAVNLGSAGIQKGDTLTLLDLGERWRAFVKPIDPGPPERITFGWADMWDGICTVLHWLALMFVYTTLAVYRVTEAILWGLYSAADTFCCEVKVRFRENDRTPMISLRDVD